MQISKIIKATITKTFIYQPVFPVRNRWLIQIVPVGTASFRKMFS